MKNFTQYLIVAAIIGMAALNVQARTISINVREVKGDLTEYLRNVGQTANYKDTVVLNFDEGSYIIKGSIIFHSHLVMKGMGQQSTAVVFNKGNDRAGFKAFTDDCFIDVFGTLAHPLSADISDISFQLQGHKGIWWENSRNYLFKIRHCNRVNITRVNSYIDNAISTNFDLHVCSNVNITDCDITNYNNSDGGGCLWLRGGAHNVNIKRNKFTKYGKDETLAVFDRLVDHSKKYIRGKASRSDIFIEDNEFIYGGYQGKDKNPDAICGMILSLFTDQSASADRCMTSNFHLRGNKFIINDICTRCMYVGFDPADEHSDIFIENNEIIHSQPKNDAPYYYCDIEVHDLSASTDIIHINGNTVTNNHAIVNKFGTTGYAVVVMRGGHVTMADNTIVNNVTRNPKTGKTYGIELVWCKSDGGNSDVTLTGNVCKGLDCIAHVGAWQLAEKFSLSANNNYFTGNTRVYSESIKKLDLNFTGNTFNSQGESFFLDGFAQKGTVIFNNNAVTSSNRSGRFFTRSSGSSNGRIDQLEMQNNVIKGVNSETDMLKSLTNVGKRKVKRNSISR